MTGYRKNANKSLFIVKAIISLFAILFFAAIAVSAFFVIRGYVMYRDAVSQISLKDRIETVRSGDNFVQFSELSDFYINAVISVEDRRFDKHCGVDLIAVCRAAWTDIETMSFTEGGSTITQQVAKNLIFNHDKKIERKVAECFAAFALESEYSKKEIFELYVNTAYFGSNYYGIHDAAIGYFNKLPSELTDYEAAILAGLPNAPSSYSPDVNMELAKQRASKVLRSMVSNNIITQEEADIILN